MNQFLAIVSAQASSCLVEILGGSPGIEAKNGQPEVFLRQISSKGGYRLER